MYKAIPAHQISQIGKRYYKITILELLLESGQLKVRYRCDCGNISICKLSKLSKRCKNCYNIDRAVNKRTHGLSKTPEYKIWTGILQRCLNKKNPSYHNYGGRNIKVCNKWLGVGGFTNFVNDMGKRPEPQKDYSIERIDNNGNYTPQNCKWATKKEQLANKRQGDSIYRIHDKCCTVCQKKFKGYFKNLYCNRTCQTRAYRARKLQTIENTTSSC